MLVNIMAEGLRAHMNLWKATQEKDVQYAAFALRNLLELLVWGTYCSVSKENANRLRQDSPRDAVGMVHAIEAMPNTIANIAAFQESVSKARIAMQSFAPSLALTKLMAIFIRYLKLRSRSIGS